MLKRSSTTATLNLSLKMHSLASWKNTGGIWCATNRLPLFPNECPNTPVARYQVLDEREWSEWNCGKRSSAVSLVILTGSGPRSPGSSDAFVLMWMGYLSRGSSWKDAKTETDTLSGSEPLSGAETKRFTLSEKAAAYCTAPRLHKWCHDMGLFHVTSDTLIVNIYARATLDGGCTTQVKLPQNKWKRMPFSKNVRCSVCHIGCSLLHWL